MFSLLRSVAPGLLILGIAAGVRLGVDVASDQIGSAWAPSDALASR